MLRWTLLVLIALNFDATFFTHTSASVWLQAWRRSSRGNTSTTSSFRRPTDPKPRDCRWTRWYNVSACKRTPGSNKYQIKQKREKILQRYGGKPCYGKNEGYISCPELELLALNFLDAIGTTSKSPPSSTSSSSSSSSSPFSPYRPLSLKPLLHSFGPTIATKPTTKPSGCKTTIRRGPSGRARMIGTQCSVARRRRSDPPEEINRFPKEDEPCMELKDGTVNKKKRDMLFLIDESGSIGQDNFKKFLRMAKAITSALRGNIAVSSSQTQIALMSFDKAQHLHFNFKRFSDKSQVLNYMDTGIAYSSKTDHATCLVEALEKTRNEIFADANGARINDKNTEKVVILLTDACANCVKKEEDLQEALAILRGQFQTAGISLVTLFVGQSQSCFLNLADLADGSKCHQAFYTQNWDEFDEVTEKVESTEMSCWKHGLPCEE